MNSIDLGRGAQVVVRVDDLAFLGRGVARLDGLIFFVDGGLPGDTAKVEITTRRRRHVESRVVEILEPSPDRVAPRCRHFGVCGGCRLQNLAYEKQLAFKAAQVRNHLVRIGGLHDPGEIPILPCPESYGYRNKMEFAFGRDAEGRLILGLHPRERYFDVFDLKECHLPSPEFSQIAEITRRHFAAHASTPHDPKEHTGFLRFLVIRRAAHTGQVLVNLVTAEGDVPYPAELVMALHEAVPGLATVVRTINTSRANVAAGTVTDVWYGDGTFAETLAGLEFTLGPLSFFQTNTRQAERLFATAIEFAAPSSACRILDLYSGVGAISLLAARTAGWVTGVEVVAEAADSAREAATRNRIPNCEFVCVDVLEYVRALNPVEWNFDIVIVDPPRAGLHPKVAKRLVELWPPKIVYISCNPSTLARDLASLCAERYRLANITAVDMFPHTAHIEAVALLHAV